MLDEVDVLGRVHVTCWPALTLLDWEQMERFERAKVFESSYVAIHFTTLE
jgi:hypothetical protein